MKFSNITTLIVPFLLLGGCDEKTPVEEKPPVIEQVVTQPEKLTPEQELEKLQKEAEAGDATAQFRLAKKYYDGEGLPQNLVKAAEWYEKSATLGNAEAQLAFGMMCGNGEGGITADMTKAVEWVKKAAEQGYAKAQSALGRYYKVDSVPLDNAKEFEWFQKAAEQGDAESQFELGQMYWIGKGVVKDAIKAFEWFEKAANQGYAEAQYRLFFMYNEGNGIPKNSVKESEFLHKAAASGMADAQHLLGLAYSVGNRAGVNKDKIRAYAWLNLAAAQNDKNARQHRDDFEKQLTQSELTEAQKLSSNWKQGDTLLASNDISDSDKVSTKTTQEPTKQKTGTAFVVSKNGHALTNHHVVNGCNAIKIAGHDGVVKLITSDSANDIALLQLPNNNDNFAKINPEPNKLRQGEDVIVFGYPLNSVLSSGGNLTFGTVSALSGLNNNTNQIQITAPIQPGSSGSPVMDKKGDIVGIVSMKLDDTKMAKATGSIGQTVNFAVNGQTVKTFLDTNNVPYKTGGGFFSMEKNNADIAEEAKKWTVLVECWK